MHHAVIPVVLQFSKVAANSNLNFTFTTCGAKWSLGWRMGDSLGFSYNVVPDDIYDAESCLQSVSFNGDVLSIRTSATAPDFSNFTLTLFLQVDPHATFLQGYCTLNNEAEVYAFLGNERPVQWRNGRISAVLRPSADDYRSVLFAITGMKPGNRVGIEVSTDPAQGRVGWSLGPPYSESLGITLTSTSGQLPLVLMSYTTHYIVLQTDSASSSETSDVVMAAYLSWEPEKLPFVYLKVSCDPSISVYAQVGTRQPQLVSPTYTLFTL
ncbi:hypothetical protein FNU76_17580 [Chitinimonas arctica]|uniref:Uncharacterized protein n=1 Tax=Chitinimonas arctica TaxID=2594795 RepID=A0A516SIM8_9NEIS|nr:hypothetical protein [Chitinimonas arctica]QDQ28009.1 hypothetical protein FNU76_17580 [Chitinimonas arctica]